MNVYRFAVQDGYEWVVPTNEADFELFRGFDGASRSNGWSPIPVKLVNQDEQGRTMAESDFPWLGEHCPVIRRRAADLLRKILGRDGELLPLSSPEGDLSILNVLRVVDALDIGRSVLVRYPSSGRIMKVRSHVFRPERLGGVKVFKVPDLLHGATFVTQEVVELIERSGLKGVGFRLLWPDAPTNDLAAR